VHAEIPPLRHVSVVGASNLSAWGAQRRKPPSGDYCGWWPISRIEMQSEPSLFWWLGRLVDRQRKGFGIEHPVEFLDMIRTKSRVKTSRLDVFRIGRRARGNDQHPPAWWKPEGFPRAFFNRLSAILPRASDAAFATKPDFYHFVFFCGFRYGPPSLTPSSAAPMHRSEAQS
jgi:hypothetical protein